MQKNGPPRDACVIYSHCGLGNIGRIQLSIMMHWQYGVLMIPYHENLSENDIEATDGVKPCPFRLPQKKSNIDWEMELDSERREVSRNTTEHCQYPS
jgi:hypothetical protein